MKIYSPVKDYTGISASVPFCNGKGETDDPLLIAWFSEHGYTVVPDSDTKTEVVEMSEETVEEGKAEKCTNRTRQKVTTKANTKEH